MYGTLLVIEIFQDDNFLRICSFWRLNISAKHPILLKLCSQEDLEKEVLKSGGIIGNPTEDG